MSPRRAIRAGLPAVLAAACLVGAAPAVAAITISPADGAPAAGPATQISVLGVAPSRIVSVRATGARTGVHAGRRESYSGGRGASFLPAKPFAQGERVAVTIRLRGHATIHTSFTVAHLGAIPPVLNITATQPSKLEHYASAPGLQAPIITVHRGAATGTDPILMAPLPSPIIHPESNNTVSISPVGPGGPMIVDRQGRLVWFRQLTPPTVAANLSVQRYRGKRVLTWYQGPVTTQAFGLGEGVIADSAYRTVATVHAGNGYAVDIHELRLTGAADALITAYSPVLVHLPGTPAATRTPVLDSIVQEIDVPTGLVVWEWDALGHIPLSDSYANPTNSASYDAFHINSVQVLAHGRLLVSARDTSAVYELDQRTGRILWTLGGRRSTYRFGAGARFWLQHDARALPGDRISLFDDEAGPPQKAAASRGLVLQLNLHKRTATVLRSLVRAPDTSAQSEGSVQVGASGNAFVGYGATGFFSEFSPTGRLVFDAQLPDGDGSYRTVRAPWTGTPATPPSVAAQRTDPSHVRLSASWNGATGVARWQALAPGAKTPLATVPSAGFETTIAVASAATAFTVRALSASGAVLGTSEPVAAP